MATTLYSDDVASVDAAAEKFSSEKGLILLRPRRACCKAFYFTIPSGCYALVSRHGADEEYVYPDGTKSIIWPPGLHFPHPPWVGVSNLVTQQAIVLDLPVKACKTKDNVTVNIDIALAFRIMGDDARGENPELLRKFVHELKPRGLEQQLRDAQDEAVRALARSLRHTEIYGIRSGKHLRHLQLKQSGRSADEAEEAEEAGGGEEEKEEEEGDLGSTATGSLATEPSGRLGAAPAPIPTHRDETLVGRSDEVDREDARAARSAGEDVTDYMKLRLNKQFMPQGVEVLSIMIESCRLPKEIESQMEEKTKVISKNAQQRMFHQNNMQNTRMEEEVVTLLQTFEEKRLQEETAGTEKINEEKVKLNDAIAEARKSEASIREEANIKIQKLQAESSLEVQRIVSRNEETVAKIRAEAEKEAAQVEASTRLEVERRRAEASLRAARLRADAARVSSRAEGVVAPYLARKNAHITDLKQIDVYRDLAHNHNLIVCDAENDEANLTAVADAILADAEDPRSRSAAMARLSLVHQGSSGLLL